MSTKAVNVSSEIADAITLVLAIVMLAGIVIGIYKTVVDAAQIYYASSFDSGAKNFVMDTLSIFVILELMLGFMQYHGQRGISPLYILDAGLCDEGTNDLSVREEIYRQ